MKPGTRSLMTLDTSSNGLPRRPATWKLPVSGLGNRSLYFSAITLTTIGYGEFTPQSWVSMMLAAVEGVAGIVLLALLVFSLTKKYGSS